jgi:hypothetical protein
LLLLNEKVDKCKERHIVVNVLSYLKRLKPDKSVTGFESVAGG